MYLNGFAVQTIQLVGGMLYLYKLHRVMALGTSSNPIIHRQARKSIYTDKPGKMGCIHTEKRGITHTQRIEAERSQDMLIHSEAWKPPYTENLKKHREVEN